MRFIAHRGNIDGPNVQRENTPSYILEALHLGFDCEIDVWILDNILYSGHDSPSCIIDIDFILQHKDRLWIHCKNYSALKFFTVVHKSINCFYHDKDSYTITSQQVVWGNINSHIIENMICVMPEKYSTVPSNFQLKQCSGICSDYIQSFYSYIS
jgi:hypothetical protein